MIGQLNALRGTLPGLRPTGRHPARNPNSTPCYWTGSLFNRLNSNQISPSSLPGKAPSILLFPAAASAPAAAPVRIRLQVHEARPPKEEYPPCKPPRINNFHAGTPFQLQALNRFNRAALFHPSSCWPKNSKCEAQHIALADSTTYRFSPCPAMYTVDRGESALVVIRISLCSASRPQQPDRPVSGIPASPAANRRILASLRLPASRAFYAVLNNRLEVNRLEVEANHNHPGCRPAASRVGCRGNSRWPEQSHAGPAFSGINLKLIHLRKCTTTIGTPDHPCDASCRKGPPDASQNPGPPPQPKEKESLTTS